MQVQTNVQLFGKLAHAGWAEADLLRADRAYRLATAAFGDQFRPDGRPFLCHLCGTAGLVADAGGAPDTVLAALLHAQFTQGGMAQAGGASARNRQAVADVAGGGPLAIILAYDVLRWSDEAILSIAEAMPEGLAREALLIRLANEADDSADGAAAFSAKRRYAGRPDLLAGIDRIADAIGAPQLAAALRNGLAEADALRLPVAMRRECSASFALPGKRPPSPLWRRAARKARRMLHG